ncbi:chemotaxis protein CheW [Vibrio metoecus]|uniref:chemotaxis protein CheW n=1 Tax=Vibrio metoecus TaxID=1481663 RepID=UPI0006D7D07C|nr:chemotaxis protein CheW [Vibrio metoecus]KQA20585.1 chemotaxis protein CheW [Vibrio metoecus]
MMQREFLSFILDDEEYGIPILEVREVRGWSPVRVIPNAPPFVIGLLDIRGEYIPILDLKRRLGLVPVEINATTVVVVINAANQQPLGLIVDAVAEVYALSEQEIKRAPSISTVIGNQYVKGIAAIKNRHLVLIDIDALFDVEALNLSSTAESTQ